MAIHWKIPFKSLRGTTYNVNIYDDAFSDTPVVLDGAAEPFVTEEDDNDDLFTPVRTQSGYIRFVINGNDNVDAMYPSSILDRPVTLTNGNGDLLWKGYIQPQTFSGPIAGYDIERQLPVCCMLSALESFDVENSNTTFHNFASLLEYALNKVSFSGMIVIQGVASVTSWLLKQVNWSILVDTDADGVVTPKYNCLQLIEEVCRYFGWTARLNGTALFLVSPADTITPTFITLSMTELHTLATGTSVSKTASVQVTKTIGNNRYASMNNALMNMPGWRRATVIAPINKQQSVIDINWSLVEKHFRNSDVTKYEWATDKYVFVKNPQTLYTYDVGTTKLQLLRPSSTNKASAVMYDTYEGNINYKHRYDFTTAINIQTTNGTIPSSINSTVVRLKGKQQYWLNQGYIVISAKICRDVIVFDGQGNPTDHKTYVGQGTLYCYLRVGDKYFCNYRNGVSQTPFWSSSFEIFTMPTGTDQAAIEPHPYEVEGMGEIRSNRHLTFDANNVDTTHVPDYDGYGILTTDSQSTLIGGDVEFGVLYWKNQGAGQPNTIYMQDLKIEFFRGSADLLPSEDEENKYTLYTGAAFRNEKEVTTLFATDKNNAFGQALVLNPNGTYCQGVDYADSSNSRPEQHLVARMAAYGASFHKKKVCEVDTYDVGEILPSDNISFGISGHPASIGHGWRDDITKLTIIEE